MRNDVEKEKGALRQDIPTFLLRDLEEHPRQDPAEKLIAIQWDIAEAVTERALGGEKWELTGPEQFAIVFVGAPELLIYPKPSERDYRLRTKPCTVVWLDNRWQIFTRDDNETH